MTRFVLAVIMLAFAGCASWSPFRHPSATLLAKADGLLMLGDYTGALRAYDDVVAADPAGDTAMRARATRETVAELLTARTDLARLRAERLAGDEELGRLRRELAGRDAELQRLRQELASRQAEAERLRADLEQLKRIDLAPERRR